MNQWKNETIDALSLGGRKRIVVAMSGGVDSATSAAMLAAAGHEVIGITLRLWAPSPWAAGQKFGSCCSAEDVSDARCVAGSLNIPHYTFDLEKKFRETVVNNFIDEYVSGRTPNPCVRCNAFIKFDVLFQYALTLGADYLCTGHYARIQKNAAGSFDLRQAADPDKDQSYFLYMLGQKELSRLLFPLGCHNKDEVRQIAQDLNVSIAKKRDSQDVCFLEGQTVRSFLESQKVPETAFEPGPILTRDGKVLGQHQGLAHYTIGQRDRLGIAVGERVYVLDKDSRRNALIVGAKEETSNANCRLTEVRLCDARALGKEFRAIAKIRYRHKGVPVRVSIAEDATAQVQFNEPVSALAPGQSLVFYDGDRVLGGGLIETNTLQ